MHMHCVSMLAYSGIIPSAGSIVSDVEVAVRAFIERQFEGNRDLTNARDSGKRTIEEGKEVGMVTEERFRNQIDGTGGAR